MEGETASLHSGSEAVSFYLRAVAGSEAKRHARPHPHHAPRSSASVRQFRSVGEFRRCWAGNGDRGGVDCVKVKNEKHPPLGRVKQVLA